MRFEIPEGWAVALDLGRDRRATTADALYIESALREHGVRTVFYPWHPDRDVLTPHGATRPLQLLVEIDRLPEAQALRDDVLEGRSDSLEVIVPVDDTWVRRFDLMILYRRVEARAQQEGGLWTASLWMIRVAFALVVGLALIGMLSAGADTLPGVFRGT